MPDLIAPSTVEELRDAVHECGRQEATVELGGSFSKRSFGGPVAPADRCIETARLNRVLAYEPADLTVSVEAGMPIAKLNRILARNNQILPLDPPCSDSATVGGVLASNASGSRRRRYGTARDMVIGMRFATLDGKLVSSGGMVVKNVTGLDMGKLMIGSFGTLAAIASANFKVFPKPESSASFLFRCSSVEPLLAVRSAILTGQLQPVAIDWLDPSVARFSGLEAAHSLLVEATGSDAVTRRYRRAFEALAASEDVDFEGVPADVWSRVRECGPSWLCAHRAGALLRVSTVLSRLGELLSISGSVGCGASLRAGNATGTVMAPDGASARAALSALRRAGMLATLEAGPDALKQEVEQWAPRAAELLLMQRIKADFDPLVVLNRGRLYGVL